MKGFLLCLVLLLVASLPIAQAQSPDEAVVLEDLIEAWNLTEIGWIGNASDACTLGWPGLTCSADNTTVTGIAIGDHSLTGTIPESIGRLSNLDRLNLSGNQISGTIPESVGELSNLLFILFVGNNLNGSLPSSIGRLSQLRDIWLPNNELSGSIPESVGKLTSLQNLWLSSNRLSGTIPTTLGLLGGSLTQLMLNSNLLTGSVPEELGALTKLTWLLLDNNTLDGFLPSSLLNVSGHGICDLSGNPFWCPIPGNLSSQCKAECINGTTQPRTTTPLPTTTVPTTVPASSSPAPSPPPHSYVLPIVLGTIGLVAVLVLIAALAWWLCRRSRVSYQELTY